MLPNKAGQSTAYITPLRYAAYSYGGDRSGSVKGDRWCEILMQNVAFTDYTTMRETDLGFSSSPDDISKQITIQLDAPDQSTASNYNATVIHRPGEDTTLSDDGRYYARVVWTVIVTGTT